MKKALELLRKDAEIDPASYPYQQDYFEGRRDLAAEILKLLESQKSERSDGAANLDLAKAA